MSDTYTGPFDGVRANGQRVEKQVRDYRGFVDVHSIFHTIQGEGPFCGTPSVFVRLAGCNLVCPFCDTEYTEGRQGMRASEVMAQVREYMPHGGLIVITGGEPFRQPDAIADLIDHALTWGYFVQVETNGVLPPPPLIDWNTNIGEREGAYIVCSPKSGKVDDKVWKHACCAKYVGTAGDLCDDGLPRQALGHPVKDRIARPPVGFSRPIYLQPVDHQDEAKNAANLKEVIASCMKHGFIIQIQIHKILDME